MDSGEVKNQWIRGSLKSMQTEIPEYIIDKILMCTLMMDKTIPNNKIQSYFDILRESIEVYLSNIKSGFVSNNSEDFKQYIEEKVGKVYFSKAFAVRIRPDSVRLFINGKEILN